LSEIAAIFFQTLERTELCRGVRQSLTWRHAGALSAFESLDVGWKLKLIAVV
jgi:hypothetical protein